MTAQDAASPAPGVYGEDQLHLGGRRQRPDQLASLLAEVQDAHQAAVDALEAELREVRRQRDTAERVVSERGQLLDEASAKQAAYREVCREDAEANAARAEKAEQEAARLRKVAEETYQRGWRQGQEQRLEWRRERDQAREQVAYLEGELEGASREAGRAREQAAECMREAAQLHRALDSLGTSPERLAQQVGAGMAVELFGRTYVDRDTALTRGALREAGLISDDDGKTWAGAEELAGLRDGTVQVQGDLLEAASGVFVPIPAGHMLSVTVTPYDSTPTLTNADTAELERELAKRDRAEHVCSVECHSAGCPG